MKKPYAHQLTTSKFLLRNPRAFCWSDAGTGKTLSCLLSMRVLQNSGLKRVLIISTLSTMQNVWGNELFCLFPQQRYAILEGSKQRRLELLSLNNVCIINHDGIKVIKDELAKWRPELVVVDEHTAFKVKSTARWKALNSICEHSKHVWMLSGTPCPQAPTDLFAPARIICPDLVGKSFLRFRESVMFQVSMYKWIEKPNWQRQIASFPAIRFSRQECLDLPAVTKSTIEVPLSAKQKLSFEILRRDALVLIDSKEVTATHEGVLRSKLLQCCGGYVYSTPDENNNKDVVDLRPDERLAALVDLIDECPRGVLVFAPFISMLDNLKNVISKEGYSCAIICGDTSGKERNILFQKFQDGEIKVLIAHPRTMAHGVTLTYADTVIWYIVTSDAELYDQANARINRIGQHNKMRVIHLLSTAFERMVLDRLDHKRSMQGLLLEVFKQ